MYACFCSSKLRVVSRGAFLIFKRLRGKEFTKLSTAVSAKKKKKKSHSAPTTELLKEVKSRAALHERCEEFNRSESRPETSGFALFPDLVFIFFAREMVLFKPCCCLPDNREWKTDAMSEARCNLQLSREV